MRSGLKQLLSGQHWVWWLFFGALGFRLAGAAASLLWYDEAFTALMAKLPLPQMLTAIRGDVHPPLWYLIEWAVAHTVGASEMSLRLPAALFGAGSTVLLYRLVKKFSGEQEARWASGLLAVMPGQLYYSQEARMYTLLTFLVLFGANAVQDRKWFRVGASMVLLLCTQNLGAVYAAILGGWALWVSRGRAIKTLLPVGAFYIPQGLVALRQFATVGSGFWLSTPGNLGGALYWIFYTTLFVRLPVSVQLHGIAASLIVTLAALYGLRPHLRKFAPLIVLAFAPPLILYAASVTWKPVLLDRAMLPSGAMLVGLWGAAIPSLPQWVRKPLAALGVPMLVIALASYYIDPTNQRPKTEPMVEIIREEWQPGDAIYHTHLTSLITFDWYLPDYPAYVLPEAGDLSQSLSGETKTAMGLTQREYLPQALRAIGYKRLWLISGDTVMTSQHEIDAQELFVRAYPTIQQWHIETNSLAKVTLYLLEL